MNTEELVEHRFFRINLLALHLLRSPIDGQAHSTSRSGIGVERMASNIVRK